MEKILKTSILKFTFFGKLNPAYNSGLHQLLGLRLLFCFGGHLACFQQFSSKEILYICLVSVCSSNWCKPRHVSYNFKKKVENKIIKFLDGLLTYDWNKLNKFEDMFEQSNKYKEILNQFEYLINKESHTKDFNFENVYKLLISYDKKFKEITYFGILKHIVNTKLLPGQLHEIVKKIEFENYKKYADFPKCECRIRYKFEIKPKLEFLTRLGCNYDGYYDTYIYKCQICEFEWMATVDDINGTGEYTIWNKTTYPINNKNCS